MKIGGILGLSIAFNGAFIALANVNLYHINWLGLVFGGAIMLAGGFLIVKETIWDKHNNKDRQLTVYFCV